MYIRPVYWLPVWLGRFLLVASISVSSTALGRPASRHDTFHSFVGTQIPLGSRRSSGHQARPSAPFAAQLTVLGPNARVAGPSGAASFDFGRVDPLATPSIEHTFLLRNGNHFPLLLENPGTSCGCTAAFWTPSSAARVNLGAAPEGGPGERILKPDGTIALRVFVNTFELHSGPAEKLVWVYAGGQTAPVITLHLKMDVSAPVVFGQEVLHFGTVAPDSFTTQTITVHLAPELAQDPRVFLVATDPRIVVRPASVQKAGRDSGAKPPGSALASQEERVYRVSLRATRMLGPVTASLRIFRMAPPGALRVVGVRKVRMLPAPTLIGPEVPVLGSVAGELSATPDSVIIPAVFQGDAITRSVDIQAVRTQASTLVPGLEVTADSPALTVAIMPLPIPPAIALTGSSSAAHEGASSGPISAPCARLLVTIATERIQPGLFNASVLLTAPDGTQLSVPVRALIQQPPRPTSGLRP